MPGKKVIHWNPPEKEYPESWRKTKCGRRLSAVEWTKDRNDATCNNCLRGD